MGFSRFRSAPELDGEFRTALLPACLCRGGGRFDGIGRHGRQERGFGDALFDGCRHGAVGWVAGRDVEHGGRFHLRPDGGNGQQYGNLCLGIGADQLLRRGFHESARAGSRYAPYLCGGQSGRLFAGQRRGVCRRGDGRRLYVDDDAAGYRHFGRADEGHPAESLLGDGAAADDRPLGRRNGQLLCRQPAVAELFVRCVDGRQRRHYARAAAGRAAVRGAHAVGGSALVGRRPAHLAERSRTDRTGQHFIRRFADYLLAYGASHVVGRQCRDRALSRCDVVRGAVELAHLGLGPGCRGSGVAGRDLRDVFDLRDGLRRGLGRDDGPQPRGDLQGGRTLRPLVPGVALPVGAQGPLPVGHGLLRRAERPSHLPFECHGRADDRQSRPVCRLYGQHVLCDGPPRGLHRHDLGQLLRLVLGRRPRQRPDLPQQ